MWEFGVRSFPFPFFLPPLGETICRNLALQLQKQGEPHWLRFSRLFLFCFFFSFSNQIQWPWASSLCIVLLSEKIGRSEMKQGRKDGNIDLSPARSSFFIFSSPFFLQVFSFSFSATSFVISSSDFPIYFSSLCGFFFSLLDLTLSRFLLYPGFYIKVASGKSWAGLMRWNGQEGIWF